MRPSGLKQPFASVLQGADNKMQLKLFAGLSCFFFFMALVVVVHGKVQIH